MKIIFLVFTKSRDWLRTHLVFSKSLVFIWGMVLSYGFVKIGVTNVLTDYYLEHLFDKFCLRNALMVGNMQDGLSCIFVVVAHFSESYVGHFNVIILCTAATVTGLMLLWVSESYEPSKLHLPAGLYYVAIILVALGDAMESTLEDFLECQLKEKIKRRTDTTTISGSQIRDEENNVVRVIFRLWWYSAFLTGSVMASTWFAFKDWTEQFKIAALSMAAAYFWFYFGCFSYVFEVPSGSPLSKMYRVFKAAMGKLKLRLPASEDGYHWKNITQNEYFYRRRDGQVRLKPHVPSLWRWLDKAAIVEENSINDEHCSVEEVREVKYVASLTHFGITLLPCGLVKAAGSTFFIEQAKSSNYISLLLLLKFCTRESVVVSCWFFKLNRQRRSTIRRIAAGIICAVLCCFVAWLVGPIYGQDKEKAKSMSVAILIPQYILLGLAEGLASKGFQQFFRNHVPESMWSLKEAFTQFFLGVGNFLNIPCVYFFVDVCTDSINQRQLKWYYLTLGILNVAALPVFGYYSWNYAYNEGGTREMGQISEQSQQEGQELVVPAHTNYTALQISNDAATPGSSTVVASEEQPLRRVMQQINPGTGLVSRSSSMVRRDQTTIRSEPN